MKIPEEINLTDGEELSRRLRRNRTSSSKFFLDAPWRDVANALLRACIVEIEARQHRMADTPEIRSHIESIAKWLVEPAGPPGLLMLGTMGNGKTTIASAIANLLETISRAGSVSVSRQIEVPLLEADEICSIYFEKPDDFRRLKEARYLAIDELGAEPPEVMHFGMVHTPVIDLLRARYNRQRFTIVTSNLTAKELEKHVGERVFDRFREMFLSVVFTAPSFRKLNRNGEETSGS